MSTIRYLTAIVAGEAFGIAIAQIRDLLRVPLLKPIAMGHGALRGRFELRGKPVFVIDLRMHFGRTSAPPPLSPCLVVVELEPAGRPRLLVGLIVDTVEEVFCVGDCEPASCPLSDRIPTLGECRIRGVRKQLLDLAALLPSETRDAIDRLDATA
jgi:chemotaxis signal transduction protein